METETKKVEPPMRGRSRAYPVPDWLVRLSMRAESYWVFDAPVIRHGWTCDAMTRSVSRDFETPKGTFSIGFYIYPIEGNPNEQKATGEVLDEGDYVIRAKDFQPSIDGLLEFYRWADEVMEAANNPPERLEGEVE